MTCQHFLLDMAAMPYNFLAASGRRLAHHLQLDAGDQRPGRINQAQLAIARSFGYGRRNAMRAEDKDGTIRHLF